MKSNHTFKLSLDWDFKESDNSLVMRKAIKNHVVKIIGKDDLNISAAQAFKGDPTLYNPEDLLLASLTSCHMMSYLYCCVQHKVEVLSYRDHSEALLEVSIDGSGRIVKVMLNPIIEISDLSQIDLAYSLHEKANELCFIANSCNFPVEHSPQVLLRSSPY